MKNILIILLTLILNGNFVYGQTESFKVFKSKKLLDEYQDSIRKIEINKYKKIISLNKEITSSVEKIEDSVIVLINNYRDSIGLNKLIYVKECNNILREASKKYVDTINTSFNIENIKDTNSKIYGHIYFKNRHLLCNQKLNGNLGFVENFIGGVDILTVDPYKFFYDWLNSDSHRKNIELKNSLYVTIGLYINSDGHYAIYNCFMLDTVNKCK